MAKLHFLSPDLATTAAIVSELRERGFDESSIHLIANDKIDLGTLPEASVMEESDLVPAMKRGAALGGAAGLLGGLVAVTFPPAGLAFGGGALLATTVGGATFGAWASSLIGASVDNSELREFEEAIAAGKILMLVEVDEERADDITALILNRYPDAELKRTDSPAVPPAV